MLIETPRLLLIPCYKNLLAAVLEGNDALREYLDVNVPEKWTEFGDQPLRYSYKKILEDPENVGWWTYLPILKSENTLVGSCGYKGKPDAEGMVEIGYEVAESYRNQGLATEIARGLIERVLHNDSVKIILAHTLPEENASVTVLRKCGMEWVQVITDPEDGNIWRWRIMK